MNLDEIVGKTMRTTKYMRKTDFKLVDDKIYLIPFGDIHWGSPECDKDKVMEVVDWIYKTPNAYVIGMGDMLEAATRTSVGAGVYEQITPVQQQLDEMVAILKPMADKGKLLGMLDGNHERRIYNATGLDITATMCRILGVKYFGKGAFLDFKVGKQKYTTYAVHGSSGARLPHTKIKSCMDLSAFVNTDIYLMGHLHELDHKTASMYYPDTKDRVVKSRDKHFLLTGSFLNYFGGYAQQMNLRPAKLGCPKIKLGAKNYSIRVSN